MGIGKLQSQEYFGYVHSNSKPFAKFLAKSMTRHSIVANLHRGILRVSSPTLEGHNNDIFVVVINVNDFYYGMLSKGSLVTQLEISFH